MCFVVKLFEIFDKNISLSYIFNKNIGVLCAFSGLEKLKNSYFCVKI